jgi:hypothetical protein
MLSCTSALSTDMRKSPRSSRVTTISGVLRTIATQVCTNHSAPQVMVDAQNSSRLA